MGRAYSTTLCCCAVGWLAIACGAREELPPGRGGGGEAASDGGSGGSPSVGGDPSSSGGNGGGVVVPRTIEIDFKGPESLSRARVRAFVNDATGALKQSLFGTDLPADVEVDDGDMVTFFGDGEPVLRSYRVTPEVFRIVESYDSDLEQPCETQPMDITVTFPEVPGALYYSAITNTPADVWQTDAGEGVLHVEICADTFDLLAFAHDGDAIIGFELLEDIPFKPGSSESIPVSLSDTTRRPVSVELEDLDGLEQVYANAEWQELPWMFPHETVNEMTLSAPPGSVSYAPETISPSPGFGGPHVVVTSGYPSVDGVCDRQGFVRYGNKGETVTVSPTRLAGTRSAGMNSWEFSTDGEHGDVVWQSWDYSGGLGELVWLVWEDAQRPPMAAVRPELPGDVPWPDDANAMLYGIGHLDFTERESYAALVAEPLRPQEIRTEQWRVSVACE
ncbi:MAG: hypothetical protein HOW73_09595 [Polyangiaceae bacterium]|nr:hypothetical protein [Polyangiaceae bacterium]